MIATILPAASLLTYNLFYVQHPPMSSNWQDGLQLLGLGIAAMLSPVCGLLSVLMIGVVIPSELRKLAWRYGQPTNGLPQPKKK